MDLSACARPHLFLRVLFAGFSDSWIEWPARNSSSRSISGGRRKRIRPTAFLVRAYVAVVFEQLAHADGAVLVGIVASMLVVANVWSRAMLMGCFACFLSF